MKRRLFTAYCWVLYYLLAPLSLAVAIWDTSRHPFKRLAAEYQGIRETQRAHIANRIEKGDYRL